LLYYYKIEDLIADFDNIFNKLKIYYKLIYIQNLINKNKFIDIIIYDNIFKIIKFIIKILDIINNLVFWYIQEIKARVLAME
jgi:hypothetical protein